MDFSHQQHGSGDLEIWDDMKPSYVRWGQTDVAIHYIAKMRMVNIRIPIIHDESG